MRGGGGAPPSPPPPRKEYVPAPAPPVKAYVPAPEPPRPLLFRIGYIPVPDPSIDEIPRYPVLLAPRYTLEEVQARLQPRKPAYSIEGEAGGKDVRPAAPPKEGAPSRKGKRADPARLRKAAREWLAYEASLPKGKAGLPEPDLERLREAIRTSPLLAKGGKGTVPAGETDRLEALLSVYEAHVRRRAQTALHGTYRTMLQSMREEIVVEVNTLDPRWDLHDRTEETVLHLQDVLADGGSAAASAAVEVLVAYEDAPPSAEPPAPAGRETRLRRPSFAEEAHQVLVRIGGREALPAIIEAFPLAREGGKAILLETASELAMAEKAHATPDPESPKERWIAWYERRWGPWPLGDPPALEGLDLSPGVLIPKPGGGKR